MPLLSQRYPAVYAVRVAQLRLERRVWDVRRRTPLAASTSTTLLPVTVVRHESLLRRRLGAVDPALHDAKVANLALAIPSIDRLLLLPGETTRRPAG